MQFVCMCVCVGVGVCVWVLVWSFIQAQIKKKHQSPASLAFVGGIHPHIGPVTRKIFPFDDAIHSKGRRPRDCTKA